MNRPDDPQRFGLHPLLREYALERLDEAGQRTAVETAHARWVEQVAQETGERILGPTGEAILHQLDHEQHNLRAALGWSVAPGGDVAIGWRIMGWTWRWFQQRAHLREGRALAHDLLAAPSAVAETRARIGRGSPLTAASPTGWTMSRAPGRATRSALRSPRRPAIRCSSPMRTTTSASPR